MFENIFFDFCLMLKIAYKYLIKRGFRTVKHGTLKKIGNKTKRCLPQPIICQSF
jgi:hypothetical protein